MHINNFLTCSAKEEKHTNPVDPEQHEAEESPEGLQDQQGKVDEHFTRHVEQGDGKSHTLPHEEQHQQEDDLKTCTKTCLVISNPTIFN